MNTFIAETFGTKILIALGNGVVFADGAMAIAGEFFGAFVGAVLAMLLRGAVGL